MTVERFEQLIEALTETAEPHEVPSRIESALWFVLQLNGTLADEALETFCAERVRLDARRGEPNARK